MYDKEYIVSVSELRYPIELALLEKFDDRKTIKMLMEIIEDNILEYFEHECVEALPDMNDE